MPKNPPKTYGDAAVNDAEAADKVLETGNIMAADFLMRRAAILATLEVASQLAILTKALEKRNG